MAERREHKENIVFRLGTETGNTGNISIPFFYIAIPVGCLAGRDIVPKIAHGDTARHGSYLFVSTAPGAC